MHGPLGCVLRVAEEQQPGFSRTRTYAIGIFLIDIVLERLVTAFAEILRRDLDQVGDCGLV